MYSLCDVDVIYLFLILHKVLFFYEFLLFFDIFLLDFTDSFDSF